MITAIDTNVISTLWSKEPATAEVILRLQQAARVGPLIISAPVFAELLAHPGVDHALVVEFLTGSGIRVDFDLDEEIWTLAGSSFATYAARRRKSRAHQPRGLLIDFLIGSHAVLRADVLLTRDPDLYRRDFPTLQLA